MSPAENHSGDTHFSMTIKRVLHHVRKRRKRRRKKMAKPVVTMYFKFLFLYNLKRCFL